MMRINRDIHLLFGTKKQTADVRGRTSLPLGMQVQVFLVGTTGSVVRRFGNSYASFYEIAV